MEDEIAIQCWEHYCPLLCKSGVMTMADIHNLEMFCIAYATWRHCIAEAGREITILQENGTLKKNPALSAANESFKQVQSIGALMGLDPANRTKIIVPGGGKLKDNKFKAMIGLMNK
jgi:P27 family predicted phage terminase small subunit